ncbi:hypothetical protein BD769DRAFT_1460497 [Suillus cothurnatus]|nr:hypothetical protein BD769DRAFT_1460497 [Suillus cothurnatus]
MVVQPDQSGQPTIRNILPNWVMTVPFLCNGRGCQHMKVSLLIFYKTGRLCVVISNANLNNYDWRDIKNYPNLPLQTISDLQMKGDWSKVKVKLVPSIAGKHEGWPNVILTGHTRLMKAIRDMGLRTRKGKAAKDLIVESQFYWSARGESAENWLDELKSRHAKLSWLPVKTVFPSLKTVHDSVLGEQGGGTMFCCTNQWEASKFPQELFHDSNSTGGRVLMHTKMVVATYHPKKSIFETSNQSKGKEKELSESETKPESNDIEIQNDPIGWAYVVNYELGIIFPLYNAKDVERVSCFKRPVRKYVSGQMILMQK